MDTVTTRKIMLIVGNYDGTSKEQQVLKEKIQEVNPHGRFIRITFKIKEYGYFAKEETVFKGVARITNDGSVGFFKTVKSGNRLNIHSYTITDIELLPFTRIDIRKWELVA